MLFHQQQQQIVVEENMPNLTSGSGETISVSSSNRTEASDTSFNLQHQNFALQTQQQEQAQIPKRKRNQPGNPDPDAEVISLSPRSLLATNRFVCEICNKGFQRDQNLQLHRRGHNLPWKLKQRANKDVVRKKVYVCPEPSCVHHDPRRALGDLTGIKKHYCRKHGEKKWKCEKCSKKYAVRSDWKAHSKTCGTREYRCDCGTLFSRRDSFITHRAFCDALAEESAKAITTTVQANQLMISPTQNLNLQIPKFEENNNGTSNALPHKKEQTQSANLVHNHYTPRSLHDHIISPPWLSPTQAHPQQLDHPYHSEVDVGGLTHTGLFSHPSSFHVASPHMSATALLQKAAQMGSSTNPGDMAADDGSSTGMITTTGAEISNMNASLFQGDYMMNSATGFDQVGSFDETLGGFLRSDTESRTAKIEDQGGEGMTRDFLGLKPLSHSDILSFAGLGNCISSDEHQQQHSQSQKPWRVVLGETRVQRSDRTMIETRIWQQSSVERTRE